MTLIVLALAVFRMSRLIVDDDITEPLRAKITQPFLSELISCVWCTSIWLGIAGTVAYAVSPEVTFWISLPFALSAVAGILDSIS